MAQFSPSVTNAFTVLGLNNKQIILLSHLYELGRVRVHEISPDISLIRRTELYSLLNYLVKVQLVEKFNVNNVTCYELKSNAEIIRWANKRRIQAEEAHNQSVDAVARIKDLLEEKERGIEPRPFFNYLEGLKGLETAHKMVMSHAKYVDIYINYKAISVICPNYVKLLIATLKTNSDINIRMIIIDQEEFHLPIELRQEPQLFLRRSKKERKNTLLCIGNKWIIDFTMNGSDLKGVYMYCQDFDCMRIFEEIFNKDWDDAEEIL